jgi:Flp pilus assembly protein TadG
VIRNRADDGGRRAAVEADRRQRGQAFVETAISLVFLMLLVLGLLQLTLLVTSKHLVNYAAFAAGRAGLYGASNDPASNGADREAADSVLRMFNVGRSPSAYPIGGGYVVRWGTPFSLPLFPFAGGIVWVESHVPSARQPYIGEYGDNAGR